MVSAKSSSNEAHIKTLENTKKLSFVDSLTLISLNFHVNFNVWVPRFFLQVGLINAFKLDRNSSFALLLSETLDRVTFVLSCLKLIRFIFFEIDSAASKTLSTLSHENDAVALCCRIF